MFFKIRMILIDLLRVSLDTLNICTRYYINSVILSPWSSRVTIEKQHFHVKVNIETARNCLRYQEKQNFPETLQAIWLDK